MRKYYQFLTTISSTSNKYKLNEFIKKMQTQIIHKNGSLTHLNDRIYTSTSS